MQLGDRIRYLKHMFEFRNQRPVVMQRQPSSSGKLVTGAADLAPAEPDVSYVEEFPDTASSKESITANSGTESHNTSSYSVSTGSCEKPVAGAAEFEKALQDPNVASSKELLDTTSLGELSCENVDAESMHAVQDREDSDIDKIIAELMAEFSLEELITCSQQKMPHNTTGGSQQPASSVGYKILIRFPRNCYQSFYVRMDRTGYFRTYPDMGGPFHSIYEADIAINRFIDELWQAERCNEKDEFSHGDRMIHGKYYLYGPPMENPSSPSSETLYDEKYLIQALLDHYNADNNLFGDLAHELNLVRKQIIIENPWWYCHLYFTTKQQADDSAGNKLFFAELSYTLGEKTWQVNCCCIIEPQDDDGGHCYGCRKKSNGMQHPKNTDANVGGHVDSGPGLTKSNYEEDSDVDAYVDEDDMDEDDDVEDEPDDDDDDDVEDDDSEKESDVDKNDVMTRRRAMLQRKWMNSLLEEFGI